MDPASVELDGSDQTWCILSAMAPRADFNANYPDADPCSATTVRGAGDYSNWITENEVRIAEYYRIRYEKAMWCCCPTARAASRTSCCNCPRASRW
jgi:hypothetical protein